MSCPVCKGHGWYLYSRDPDLDDLCACPAGDQLRSPGEMALKLLMNAFNEERTPRD